MSAPAAALPRPVQSVLRRGSVDPERTWLWLLFTLLLRPGSPNAEEWALRRAALFPHIDFTHLRFGDVFRIPVQMLWLALVRPPHARQARPPGVRDRGRMAAQFLRRRLPGVLPASTRRRLSGWQQKWPEVQVGFGKKSEELAHHPFWDHRLLRYAAYAFSVLGALFYITTPFNTLAQTTFVVLLLLLAAFIRRVPGRLATLLLLVLSITVSTRYLWWRFSYTLNWDESLDLIWGIVLIGAELYAWTILLLGFFQGLWPLNRKPVPLPEDTDAWPSVDVFIPTYDEPISVLKPTLLAAKGMDWPKEKLNIYVLDDGHRDEFRRFAEEVGVGYISRSDNRYAKAGNLNHAMTKTHGEYIAVFDCDHIPTRSFLQLTMGWFLKERELALVQTPHHFFSPDPFERNLGVFRRVPNESELFHSLVQAGNDLWNAAFFCGSCAVLRRAPLEEVGGIAVETVTEDAHTALKLHRRGYTSAYINVPQAAGLATESLSAHIGQRIRWARGMTQIFRIDNPLLGRGLNWRQRLCYSNGMLHFFNGIPRLIFLTAPLAFLMFHAYVIYAPAITVALYVLPHIIHANMANSRLQGVVRHSFWAEIYETVLAWYIALPSTIAMFAPRKGKFNVTTKGGLVEREFFDFTISTPYLVLVAVNLLGIGFGIWRLIAGPEREVFTVVLNLVWTLYNLIILGGAIAVAAEARQVRLSHRVRLDLPAILHLASGHLIRCRTSDVSEGGVALAVESIPELARDDWVGVSLWRGNEELVFPARVVLVGKDGVRLRWEFESMEQEAAMVQCTFGRADAWVSWIDGRKDDRLRDGLREVLRTGLRGYARLGAQFMPALRPLARRLEGVGESIAWWLPRMPRVAEVRA